MMRILKIELACLDGWRQLETWGLGYLLIPLSDVWSGEDIINALLQVTTQREKWTVREYR